MLRREVIADRRGIGVGGGEGVLAQPLNGFGKHLGHRLGGERVLTGKIVVEAAMRQPGGPHQVGDADAVKAMPAELGAGDLDDMGTVLRRLFAGDLHHTLRLMLSVM